MSVTRYVLEFKEGHAFVDMQDQQFLAARIVYNYGAALDLNQKTDQDLINKIVTEGQERVGSEEVQE